MIIDINIVGDGLVADDEAIIFQHSGRVIRYSVGQSCMVLHAEFPSAVHAAAARRKLERHLRIAA